MSCMHALHVCMYTDLQEVIHVIQEAVVYPRAVGKAVCATRCDIHAFGGSVLCILGAPVNSADG